MPADAVYVFDSCAVIALLQAEAGAGRDGEEIANGVKEVLAGYGFSDHRVTSEGGKQVSARRTSVAEKCATLAGDERGLRWSKA